MLVSVINEQASDVILLRQNYVSTSHWVLVAGYVAPGERLEDAARREVLEETGLSVIRTHYIDSYIHEGKDLLMIGFVALVADEDPADRSGEVDDIRWERIHRAPKLLRPGSIGHRHLLHTIEYIRLGD